VRIIDLSHNSAPDNRLAVLDPRHHSPKRASHLMLPLPPSPDAILFDFDGVIVQSVDIKAEAFATIYRNENPEIIPAIIEYQHAHGGVSRREKFRYFEREFFGRDPTPEAIEALS